LEVGPVAAAGPRLGLASRFLIQTEEGAFVRNPPRLASDVGDSGELERRPLDRTRVHSLAVIIFSTNVVGANTGILTPCQLVGLSDDGGVAGAGSGDATSHDVQSSARSHLRFEIASACFLRQFLEARASADELRLRVGEGVTGVRGNGSVPLGSPEGGGGRSPPAISSSDEASAQNRPGRRPSGSPLIALILLKWGRISLPRPLHQLGMHTSIKQRTSSFV
jgi:hypothetical protein